MPRSASPAPVVQAATDLARGMAAAHVLVARPDISPQPSTTRPALTSVPPWNAQAANAFYDAHAGVRALERQLLADVAGADLAARPRRGGSDGNTLAALRAIARLAEGADRHLAGEVAARLDRLTAATDVLPAIDHETYEQWRRIPGRPPCPYCDTPSLRADIRQREVRCFNPACRDTRGDHPRADVDQNRVSGRWLIAWADGLTQEAAA